MVELDLVRRVLSEDDSKDHVIVVRALESFKPGEFILISNRDPKWAFLPDSNFVTHKELLQSLRVAGLRVGDPPYEYGCANLELESNNHYMVYKRR